jgi:hypothetical protein
MAQMIFLISVFFVGLTSSALADGLKTPKFSASLRVSNLAKEMTEIKIFNECFFERKSDLSRPVRSVLVTSQVLPVDLIIPATDEPVATLIANEKALTLDVRQYKVDVDSSESKLANSKFERCRVRLFVRDLREEVDEDGEAMTRVELSYELTSITPATADTVSDESKFAESLSQALSRIIIRRDAKQRRFVVLKPTEAK